MSTLAEKLQAGRKAAKLNRTEFAEKVGISRRSEFSYENGTLFPSPTTIRKLADALGVTEYYLTHDDCEDPDADRAREGKGTEI